MAIVLLLAAPKSQRTANPNASFLIHEVQGGVSGTTTAVEKYAEEMRELQERIIDIYADRTGYNRDDLAAAMAEEKVRDSKYMLEHGFIGAINEYNTNQKKNNMFNWKEALGALLKRGEQAEKEGEQNGAQAAPANEIETLNARIAELEGERQNALAQVETLTQERDTLTQERVTLNEQVTNLTAERDNLQSELNTANETIAARDAEITNLKSQLGSDYQPGNRMNGQPAGDGRQDEQSSEERKNAVREALNKKKKK
jgi:chromosome segregation ATPase